MTLLEMLRGVLGDALMITGFVFAMMLLVEYMNVATAGVAAKWLEKGGLFGYGAVILIGAMPGCLGAFTDVTLYIHRIISLGALAGSMVAASGDEAFVMLAMMPKVAIPLFAGLFAYGLLVAWLVDRLGGRRYYGGEPCAAGLAVHGDVEGAAPMAHRSSFREMSFPRGVLCAALGLFTLGVALGAVGPQEWNWIRVTLLVLAAAAFAVVFIAQEHFLEEHLYRHVAKEHVPRIFAWTFGALFVMAWIKVQGGPLQAWIQAHPGWAVLAGAAIGLLPESGPHMLFVAGYATGLMPLSALVASSVVQDGHGMLPLLAQSWREFLRVKAVTFAAGLVAGYGLFIFGH
jgi:hypothetical protein